jgi:hypothetical protein
MKCAINLYVLISYLILIRNALSNVCFLHVAIVLRHVILNRLDYMMVRVRGQLETWGSITGRE